MRQHLVESKIKIIHLKIDKLNGLRNGIFVYRLFIL